MEYSIDLENRRIYVVGTLDAETNRQIIKNLCLLDTISDKPIELYICSEGGEVQGMFAIYDIIQTLRSPVHTVGIGSVMSAAVLLVACGEKNHRYACPHTSFMVHNLWTDWGVKDIEQAKNDIQATSRLWNNWYDLMEKYTGRSAQSWKKDCASSKDFYFSAEEALELGIVDQIWAEK
jgi:ATP-dependent Clp protease protease subunit